jgi:sialate O-acetylesterase
MKQKLLGLIALLAIGGQQAATAKVKLPHVLASNMVLQQDSNVKLWGKAKPNAKLSIKTSWDNKTYKTTVANDSTWLVTVKTPKADNKAYQIVFNDGEKTQLDNILMGEVWFCSGQSNMEMPMRGFDRQPLRGTNAIIAKQKPTTPIRMFITDSKKGSWFRQFSKAPQTDCYGEWLDNRPENVSVTSATAYFFAQYLQDVLDVPVGLIVSTLGGAKVEPWMSREAISQFKDIKLDILNNDKKPNIWQDPCVLYNAKIVPFLNYNIKGFLWYQGESNRNNADQYRYLMEAFVKDLRGKWGLGELPFYFVQIAPYRYGNPDATDAAKLREVQALNAKEIPNSGMVCTLDIGAPNFIHPVDKETVGTRLALLALGQTYGRKGFGYLTPTYKSMEKKDGKIYINMDNAPYGGVCPMWTSLKGFEIAGEDKVFHPAFAEVEEKTCRLAVSSKNVPNPVAVRYCYHNYAEASVFNLYGLPLAPFRTDNW